MRAPGDAAEELPHLVANLGATECSNAALASSPGGGRGRFGEAIVARLPVPEHHRGTVVCEIVIARAQRARIH